MVALTGCALWASGASAAEVAVRELGPNSYELTLTNQTPIDEKAAQAVIANAAASICKEREPVLGKYRFDSKEAIGGSATSGAPPSFVFVQGVTCGPAQKASATPRVPMLKSAQEAQRVREDIKSRSEAWFRMLAADRFDDAYAQILESTLGTDKAAWEGDQRSFQSLAGDPRSISVVAITVYDNPADAPAPGLYVAADFNNTYQNVPFQCGYLVWYRPEGGDFGITRMDIGHVTAEQLKAIPEAQLPELKRKLGCVTP